MLKQRILTAAVLAPLGVALLLWGTPAMIAVVLALILAGGMREWARFAGVGEGAQWLFAALAVALLAALWWTRTPDRLLVVAAAGVAFWLLASLWLANFELGRARTPANTALKLAAGFLVMLPAAAGALSLREAAPHGAWWLLVAVVLIWVADSGAYFAGVRFGKHKLAPKISPGKTWEGVGGAVIAVALLGLAAGWLLGLRDEKLLGLMLLAIATLAFSIVGDLFESLMKRHAGMKDSGSLIPGHGGVLDRFDSLFAALPVFAIGRHLLGA